MADVSDGVRLPLVVSCYVVSKLCSIASASLGTYIGARDLSDRFTRQVYLQGKTPPPLSSFATTVALTHVLMMGACLSASLFAIYIHHGTSSDMGCLLAWVTIDVALFSILAITVGNTLANSVGNQVYFNYKVEGLRAIRAMRRILQRSLSMLACLPLATLVHPMHASWLGSSALFWLNIRS